MRYNQLYENTLIFGEKCLQSVGSFCYKLSEKWGSMRYMRLSIAAAALLGWGVACHASERLPEPKGPVLLTITGTIEQTNAPGEARFDQAMLDELGAASIRTHTVLSEDLQHYEGVPLEAVLRRIGAKGTVMHATAANAYEVDIPFADLQYAPLLAMRANGRPLTLRDKGPLWIVYPRDAHKALQDQRYDSRWVWQLVRLHVE
jgi:hypothetical protein